MKRISADKKEITEAIKREQGEQYLPDDLAGYLIEQDNAGALMVTRPAPADEPAHYDAKTNTGGRRFVCWY